MNTVARMLSLMKTSTKEAFAQKRALQKETELKRLLGQQLQRRNLLRKLKKQSRELLAAKDDKERVARAAKDAEI